MRTNRIPPIACTVGMIAVIHDVSATEVRDAVASGDLAAIRVPGAGEGFIINRSAADRWAKRHKTSPGEGSGDGSAPHGDGGADHPLEVPS